MLPLVVFIVMIRTVRISISKNHSCFAVNMDDNNLDLNNDDNDTNDGDNECH